MIQWKSLVKPFFEPKIEGSSPIIDKLELETRYEKTKNKLDELNDEKQIRKGKLLELNSYLASFKEAGKIITDWDDNLWMTVLDKAIVNRDRSITFKFIVGIDVTI